MFDTYGPFLLKAHDNESLHDLYRQIWSADPELQYRIGVYIIAAPNRVGTLIPWYVGRTWKEFGYRIKRHYDAEKFVPLFAHGPVGIFLLALAASKAKTAMKEKSIRQLEFALIGTCLKLNPILLNVQEAGFHKAMRVPGYIDGDPGERNEAAIALSRTLGT